MDFDEGGMFWGHLAQLVKKVSIRSAFGALMTDSTPDFEDDELGATADLFCPFVMHEKKKKTKTTLLSR